MKFSCDKFKFSEGIHWFGVTFGVGTKRGERQLNIQFDLIKWGVIFSIHQKGLKFVKGYK